MKKGQVAEGTVKNVEFPNKGIVYTDEGERIIVKNTIPGQRVSFAVNKVRKGKAEARLLETVKKSPLETADTCAHFGQCGGCTYQSLPYEEQLKIKEEQVRGMIENAIGDACAYEFLPIKHSPRVLAYRNKMEFSFGDHEKGGPMTLGMHKRNSFYDIVTTDRCNIISEDMRQILAETLRFFTERNVPYYHKNEEKGFLRHLLLREGKNTGELLIDLVTTSQSPGNAALQETATAEVEPAKNTAALAGTGDPEEIRALMEAWKEAILALPLTAKVAGILHTTNDSRPIREGRKSSTALFGTW